MGFQCPGEECAPAVTLAKQVLQEAQDADVRVAHALEQKAFSLVFATEDRDEGLARRLAPHGSASCDCYAGQSQPKAPAVSSA